MQSPQVPEALRPGRFFLCTQGEPQKLLRAEGSRSHPHLV